MLPFLPCFSPHFERAALKAANKSGGNAVMMSKPWLTSLNETSPVNSGKTEDSFNLALCLTAVSYVQPDRLYCVIQLSPPSASLGTDCASGHNLIYCSSFSSEKDAVRDDLLNYLFPTFCLVQPLPPPPRGTLGGIVSWEMCVGVCSLKINDIAAACIVADWLFWSPYAGL